ncbi:LacI family DNA-binding transcriptional regulator [Streptomyces muensis]|uniref:LacI family transcriptional regulator n=1 Tax=Streptomyces muensis TaxID=1077944 RepID=A0A9X1PTJ7_STRM4|nr:LacI family DNA-binding transcriptional regulator [Streptomyces muensis]MCF1592294.1 LacI family transcriptional regulator [Streptomyces muensis]
MSNDSITIYDVASRAGVSISTVSNVLNKPKRVNADTRGRVLAIIDELGFVPRDAAISRARRGVGRIGVIAPFTAHESFRRRLIGVLKEASEQGSEVVVWDEASAAATTSPLLSSLPVRRRLDGLLIMGLPVDSAVVDRLIGTNLPAVLVDTSHPRLSSVTVNDITGGYLAARHLLGLGHRHITVVGEQQVSDQYVSQGQRRFAGIERALAEAGLPPSHMERVVAPGTDVSAGRAVVAALWAAGRRPTAFFGHSDELAAGILAELRSLGAETPTGVGVVGYDDGPLAEALRMTSVRQPLEESGRLATRMLYTRIAGPQPVGDTVLDPEVIVRGT